MQTLNNPFFTAPKHNNQVTFEETCQLYLRALSLVVVCFNMNRNLAENSLSVFTPTFLTRLPRELRDEVYSYLWDKEIVQSMRYSALLRPLELVCSCSDKRCHNKHIFVHPVIPHFIKPSVVNPIFAREAIECLYCSSSFLELSSPSKLPAFFTTDVFGLGIRPLDCKIKEMTIYYTRSELCRHFKPVGKLSAFKPLIHAKVKKGFKLRMVMSFPFRYYRRQHPFREMRNDLINTKILVNVGRTVQLVLDQLAEKQGLDRRDVNVAARLTDQGKAIDVSDLLAGSAQTRDEYRKFLCMKILPNEYI